MSGVEPRRLEFHRDGVTISYLDSGSSGPVVLLLHGLAGSAQEWAATMDVLRPRYRVLAPDLRGHGCSTRRPAEVSRTAHVDDVVSLLDTARVGGAVFVVGQSAGAHTALLLAAAHPHLVAGLVLVEGGVGGGDLDGAAEIGAWFASWPVPFPSRLAAQEHLGPGAIAASWARDLVEVEDGFRPPFDADVLQATIEDVVRTPRWTEWQQVRARTLLVRGERGTIDDREVRRMLDLRPGTGHTVVPDAGHDLHLDRPQAWADVLTGFLDGC